MLDEIARFDWDEGNREKGLFRCFRWTQHLVVMVGLVPAIHVPETAVSGYVCGVDARHKAGHDVTQNLVVPDQWG